MKKYITLAALLAAGSAFANAATTKITWDDLRECDATFFNSSQTTVGEVLSLTAVERVQFDVSSLNIDFSTGVYEFSFAVSDFTVSNAPFIAWGIEKGSSTDAQKYGFGAANSSSSSGTDCWAATINGTNMNQRYSASMSFSNTGVNGLAGLSGVFNIKIGTFDIGTETENYELEVVFTDVSGNAHSLTPNGGLDIGELSSSEIKSVTLGGWASTSNFGTSMTVTSVPEPSAFGMLAGLGALALVASRRRRK